MIHSALYHGTVTHHRTRPVAHALRYRIFLLLLDLDEAAALGRRLRLFGVDRPGLASFWQKDHGAGNAAGLRGWIDAQVTKAGMQAGGAARVLCMPRVLGHAFNPLTVIFSHAPGGALQALIYEVNNTFGQRHAYVLPVHGARSPVRQDCAKMFHVSPFMAMNLHYRFRVSVPGERSGVFITASDEDGPVLSAAFTGRRQALTDTALARAVLRMPFLGIKVLAGIHWEALKLWLKGLKLLPAPPLPAAPVTILPTATTSGAAT